MAILAIGALLILSCSLMSCGNKEYVQDLQSQVDSLNKVILKEQSEKNLYRAERDIYKADYDRRHPNLIKKILDFSEISDDSTSKK